MTPRAVGVRQDYGAVPDHVRGAVDEMLGAPVRLWVGQVGGMSPGPAARLVLEDGRRYFVKAVGAELNPDTPALFRHEAAVLQHLPEVGYRASLRACFDDGDWVVLILDDVDGRHADLDLPRDLAAVRATIAEQSGSLFPDPVGLPGENMAERVGRFTEVVTDASAAITETLPSWWRRDEVLERIDSLAGRIAVEAWCQFDVRDDNLLIRNDNSAVTVDWGMSRSGPAWLDEVMLALHFVDDEVFDQQITALPLRGSTEVDQRERDVTDLLLAMGSAMAVMATAPAPPGLPNLPAFRRQESARFLVGAGRRIALE